MMTDSVARNFQLLFDFVCDDDARFAIRWALLSLVDDNFVYNVITIILMAKLVNF